MQAGLLWIIAEFQANLCCLKPRLYEEDHVVTNLAFMKQGLQEFAVWWIFTNNREDTTNHGTMVLITF